MRVKTKAKQSIYLLLILLMVVFAAGCSSGTSSPGSLEGSFTGTALGYHGDLTVTTELDKEGKIIGITVGEHTETPDIAALPIERIPQRIIETQSLDVDIISGATLTCEGIINAVANSLENAGADPAQYGYVATEQDTNQFTTATTNAAVPVKKEITGSVTVTDVKGREVTIDLPISSYGVSTMDVIDYIVPLKGEEAFNMLVASGQDGGGGIQSYAKLYTPVVGNYLEHVGQISDHNAPFDLEMILTMNPDVLIVNSAMAAHRYALEVEDQLTQAGISLVLIDVPGKNLDTTVQQTMKLLGQIFQEEEKANQVVAFMDEQYNLLASKGLAQRENKPTVYYEKSGYSEIYGSTATSASGWGLPISIAGGELIADALLLDTAASGGSGNTLDPEYVIETNPEFIIVSGINDGWLTSPQERTKCDFDIINRIGWSNLQAVQNSNVYEFAHATSRSIYSFYPCLKMAQLFYPEEFTDLNPEAVLDEFFDRFMLLDSDITIWFTTLDDCTNQ